MEKTVQIDQRVVVGRMKSKREWNPSRQPLIPSWSSSPSPILSCRRHYLPLQAELAPPPVPSCLTSLAAATLFLSRPSARAAASPSHLASLRPLPSPPSSPPSLVLPDAELDETTAMVGWSTRCRSASRRRAAVRKWSPRRRRSAPPAVGGGRRRYRRGSWRRAAAARVVHRLKICSSLLLATPCPPPSPSLPLAMGRYSARGFSKIVRAACGLREDRLLVPLCRALCCQSPAISPRWSTSVSSTYLTEDCMHVDLWFRQALCCQFASFRCTFIRDFRRCPTFSNLKTLFLNEWFLVANTNCLICILKHAPILEKLTLQLRKVELIPLGSCKYNLKIFWTKRAGLFTKVLEALYSYNVQVLSLNTITFYGYAESFFSIEVKGEQDVVMVELKNLLSSIVEIPSI